jgi:hypothetical protein
MDSEKKELELAQRERDIEKRELNLSVQEKNMKAEMRDIYEDYHDMTATKTMRKLSGVMAPDMAPLIIEGLAERIRANPVNHVCPFNAETVASLKDLGFYFSTAQKAFKGFVVVCIVIGAIAAFLIGLKTKIMEFWATLQ